MDIHVQFLSNWIKSTRFFFLFHSLLNFSLTIERRLNSRDLKILPGTEEKFTNIQPPGSPWWRSTLCPCAPPPSKPEHHRTLLWHPSLWPPFESSWSFPGQARPRSRSSRGSRILVSDDRSSPPQRRRQKERRTRRSVHYVIDRSSPSRTTVLGSTIVPAFIIFEPVDDRE